MVCCVILANEGKAFVWLVQLEASLEVFYTLGMTILWPWNLLITIISHIFYYIQIFTFLWVILYLNCCATWWLCKLGIAANIRAQGAESFIFKKGHSFKVKSLIAAGLVYRAIQCLSVYVYAYTQKHTLLCS